MCAIFSIIFKLFLKSSSGNIPISKNCPVVVIHTQVFRKNYQIFLFLSSFGTPFGLFIITKVYCFTGKTVFTVLFPLRYYKIKSFCKADYYSQSLFFISLFNKIRMKESDTNLMDTFKLDKEFVLCNLNNYAVSFVFSRETASYLLRYLVSSDNAYNPNT